MGGVCYSNHYRKVEVRSRRERSAFIKFARDIYRSDLLWVEPLQTELNCKLDPHRNPFFNYGSAKFFMVFKGNSPVGRIAAMYNPLYKRIDGKAVGFFGFFECVNDVFIAKMLLDAAAEYLQTLHCDTLLGPVCFSTNDEVGMLIDGHDKSPMLMCNYSPPYYPELMTGNRCEKAIDLLSYAADATHVLPERYETILSRARSNACITIRPINRLTATEDIAAIRDIYNASFESVWGFVPLSREEAQELGKKFLAFSDDELVLIAHHDQRPVGCILAVRNLNEILKDLNGRLFPSGVIRIAWGKRRIKSVRVMVLCVLPAYRSLGIETLLIEKVRCRMLVAGYKRAEFSLVMENNMRMRRILESFGFSIAMRYRLYQRPIQSQETGIASTNSIPK